jgi:hypothetical protein
MRLPSARAIKSYLEFKSGLVPEIAVDWAHVPDNAMVERLEWKSITRY